MTERNARVLQKGQQTKATIVETALNLATRLGIDGLSIGVLADLMEMSKSGVFAHFGSREELQISVIHEYHARFKKEIFDPALQNPRGLPRLCALFANWMKRTSIEIDSGCVYISGAVEFDDRPCLVRDTLAQSVFLWHDALKRTIIQARDLNHLNENTNEDQMLFEIHGLILALHYEARFLKKPGCIERAQIGFESLLMRHGAIFVG